MYHSTAATILSKNFYFNSNLISGSTCKYNNDEDYREQKF